MTYTYSKHALQRFAERMKDYDSQIDVSVFIANHNEEIKERINKLIEYSDLIYTGRSTVDYNKEIVDVYLNKDGWVVIIDHKKNNVITIFNISLGLDEELDRIYLEKVDTNLKQLRVKREEKLETIDKSEKAYQEILDENKKLENELRTQLKNLEKQDEAYQEVIKSLQTDRDIADKELRSFIAKILGKKVF